MQEIASRFSFPELFLILRRAEKRRSEDLQIMAAAQLRAAFAPWSEENAKQANAFVKSLGGGRAAGEPEEAVEGALQFFGAAGIPIKEIE